MGDPSGVGSEIIIKALSNNLIKEKADFVVIGDRWVFGRSQDYEFVDLNNVNRKNFRFGKIKAEYGRAAIEYLDRALELIKNKEIDCLVTSPVSKEAINLAGFSFTGHTEYLARHLACKDFVMMLLNGDLRISLVTRHIPLRSVSLTLNREKLYKTILITHSALKNIFLIKRPRIVVCGLNPHASDNGLMGNEEQTVILPVIKKISGRLSAEIDGPISADVAISKTKARLYHCAIAMYHDQALIPLKLFSAHNGVNLTLGLPLVRTSPLHGTAFDIAGRNLADPNSLIEAIKLAVKCTLNLKKA